MESWKQANEATNKAMISSQKKLLTTISRADSPMKAASEPKKDAGLNATIKV